MKFLKSRIASVAVGAAVIGLVVAAGGGAAAFAHGYGASIGSEDIRNESIYSQDIRNGQVREGELHPSVKAQLGQGEQGPAGADGVSGYEVVGRTADAKSDTGQVTVVSPCADGDVVLSGGVKATNFDAVTIHSSFPSDIEQVQPPSDAEPSGVWAATSWTTVYTNAGEQSVQPFLVCADAN